MRENSSYLKLINLLLKDAILYSNGDKHINILELEIEINAYWDYRSETEPQKNMFIETISSQKGSLFEAETNKTILSDFHCGSIENPISVMMTKHDVEDERFRQIAKFTNSYTPLTDACNSYRLVLEEIKMFEKALHHHIHLENNIVFPRAIKIEHDLRG